MTQLAVRLNAVIVAVTREVPRILTLRRDAPMTPATPDAAHALPSGALDPDGHRTLERALRAWVREQSGLELGYVEQLYTFGDRFRDPAERHGGPRVVSVAYLALTRETLAQEHTHARWEDAYTFLPWEDWRFARPEVMDARIIPGLTAWIDRASSPDDAAARRDRVDIAFGLSGAPWDPERVLARYELLYEAQLAAEAWRDLSQPLPDPLAPVGTPMTLDHRRIIATALGRLRAKIQYRPVIFELLPEHFTLSQLQRVVEALSGVRLHTQNFRRLVDRAGLVEATGAQDTQTGGRPAALFRFRRDVLRERPAPGVGLPGARRVKH